MIVTYTVDLILICFPACGSAADVVFILDSSTSVGPSGFQQIQMYAQQILAQMNMDACDINVGALKYSSSAMVQFGLGAYQDQETISRALRGIHYTRGQANLADALRVTRQVMFNGASGDRPFAKNIAYLLTSGDVNINRDITMSEAELAFDAGITVVPLGVNLRQRDEVENIALSQGLNLVEIESDVTLQEMSDAVLNPVTNGM